MTDQTKPALLLVNGEGQTESQRARMARETHERFLAKQATLAKKEKAAEERRAELRARSELVAGRGLPSIHLSTDPDSIRSIAKAVDTGSIPDTYVRAGAVVVVETPSGAIDSGDEPIQTIVVVDPTRLARMLADHTFTYEMRREKLPDGAEALVEVETTPKAHVSASALAATNWPNLRPLRGIVTAPVFRPDGTLVQSPGYDDTTGLIYSPKLSLAEVPERPSAEEVANARTFILESLLGDFPWVGPSKANYVGMLVTPLLRTYLGGVPVPLAAVDATSPATGKSLLPQIMISIYSGYTRPWVGDDAELRKAITATLVDEAGAIVCLDNVGKGEVVDQPTLAALLTTKVWSDRILGVSTSVRVPNDRVWFVTGNSLSIGGDIASRTVLIQLDAMMPDPALRPVSEFALGDLEEWLAKPGNRATLLHHLLVLVRGWIVAGARRVEIPMRTFTPWASAAAGLLEWLDEPGFLSNRATLAEVDEEEAQYGAFFTRWHEIFGDAKLGAGQLRESALPNTSEFYDPDRKDWKGTFLVRKKDGAVPSAVGLGKMLFSERGRFRGAYRLNAHFDTHSKTWTYSVTPAPVDGESK